MAKKSTKLWMLCVLILVIGKEEKIYLHTAEILLMQTQTNLSFTCQKKVLVVSFSLYHAVYKNRVKSEESSAQTQQRYDMVHFNLVYGLVGFL